MMTANPQWWNAQYRECESRLHAVTNMASTASTEHLEGRYTHKERVLSGCAENMEKHLEDAKLNEHYMCETANKLERLARNRTRTRESWQNARMALIVLTGLFGAMEYFIGVSWMMWFAVFMSAGGALFAHWHASDLMEESDEEQTTHQTFLDLQARHNSFESVFSEWDKTHL